MTCIIGLKHNDRLYIGGDSLVSSGYYMVNELATRKVFRCGKFLIGGCGELRFLQVVEHGLNVREQYSSENDHTYMITVFTVALRDLLRTHGLLKVENNKETSDGTLIVGYRNTLYVVDGDFSCCTIASSFVTIGSGQEVALGAMAALSTDDNPEHRITTALTIAGQYISTVRAPYYVEAWS